MGVYSTNRTSLGVYSGEEIVANENYYGEIGSFQMMMEGYQNDQLIFESIIAEDFKEAAAVNEGVSLELVTEASLGGFIDKMKELIKKAWEKIKGLFKSFLTKFNNVIIRDNKKFVERYKKEVLTKDLSKMKYKWAEPTGDMVSPYTVAQAEKMVADITSDAISTSDIDKLSEEINDSDFVDEALSGILGSTTTVGEFSKDYHEKCFNDKDEEEGLKSDRLSDIIEALSNGKKAISNIEKQQKDVDKVFTTMLRNVDKARNVVLKDIPGKDKESGTKNVDIDKNNSVSYDKGNADSKTNANKRLNTLYKAINIGQMLSNKLCSAFLTEVKFHIGQSRRVFAQAASFNPKSIKENALLVEAAGEAAEYEVMSSFADYEM